MTAVLLLAWLTVQSAGADPMSHIQAGLEARKAHRVDIEIAEFRKATELDPKLADGFVNLGAAFMEKHE
jgi:hypothetical protein